jgi:hypothetical protein
MFTQKDFLGQPIKIGSKILYATAIGSSSATLTLARVVEFRDRDKEGQPVKKIGVQRMRDNRTRFVPGGSGFGYGDSNRVVLLTNFKAMVVVHPDAQ